MLDPAHHLYMSNRGVFLCVGRRFEKGENPANTNLGGIKLGKRADGTVDMVANSMGRRQ